MGTDASGETESAPGSPEIASRLTFEREKWLADCEFRRMELELKVREENRLEADSNLRFAELRHSRWSSPLVLAIIGAALATLGNAGVGLLTARDQHELEVFKAESGRILEVIKTGDPDKAAINLQFLVDAGLISDETTTNYLREFFRTRKSGQGPSTPAPSQSDVVLPSACSFDATHMSAKELIKRFDGDDVSDEQIADLAKSIRDVTTRSLSENQIQALVSLEYNIGKTGLISSSIIKYINQGEFRAAGEAIMRWARSSSGVVPGLYMRRLCERDLFASE